MRTAINFTALVGIITTLGTIPARAQVTDEAAIERTLEAFAAFSVAKNLAAMDPLWAHDDWVHIIEGAGVNHGWADYRDHHLGPELERFENFDYRFFAIEPQVRNDVAWTPFRYELELDTPTGHIEVEGRAQQSSRRGMAVG